MASKTVHQTQAKHNELIAKKLVVGDYYDWACTAAFYSALHYIEAKFNDIQEIGHTDEAYEKWKAAKKISPITTSDINQGVHNFRLTLLGYKCPNARMPYRQLMEVSRQVRYLDGGKIACDFISQQTASGLINNDLVKVKKELGFS